MDIKKMFEGEKYPATRVVFFTKEDCKEILGRQSELQRPVCPAIVRKYREEMDRGEFLFVGDPIRFSLRGELMDGQHRLSALASSILAGMDFLVVYGLEGADFDVLDIGKKRTAADLIAIANRDTESFVHSRLFAATTALIHRIAAIRSGKTFESQSPKKTRDRYLEMEEDILFAFGRIRTLRSSQVPTTVAALPQSNFLAAFYEFFKADAENAERFLRAIFDPASTTCAAVSFREFVPFVLTEKAAGRITDTRGFLMKGLYAAWRLFLKRSTAKRASSISKEAESGGWSLEPETAIS